MTRFRGGAVSEAVFRYGNEVPDAERIGASPLDYVSWLGEFDCVFSSTLTRKRDSVASVLINILERGNPTFTSPYVERILAERLDLTEQSSRKDRIEYTFREETLDSPEFADCYFRSLVPVLAESDLEHPYKLESDLEKVFVSSTLDQFLGSAAASVLRQCVEPQRSFKTILAADKVKPFLYCRVDFAWQIPGLWRGLVVEIDGVQHQEDDHKVDDRKRDAALRASNWDVLRIPTAQLHDLPEKSIDLLNRFIEIPYLRYAIQNYRDGYWKELLLQRLTQLSLVPIAVARIQRVLCELIDCGELSWDASEWHIAILERDIPAAWLAVTDFYQLASAVLGLATNRPLPRIHLSIVRTGAFNIELSQPEDDLPFTCEIIGMEDIVDAAHADVFIDLAVMARVGWSSNEEILLELSHDTPMAIIRSVAAPVSRSLVRVATLIQYHREHLTEDKLTHVLRYIFRKDRFREGQLPIIRRALAREDVIGLMPTGGGKSICYQLSGFLQPGIVAVIDPIKSLMLDQVANLNAAGIDRTNYINSFLDGDERREAQSNMVDGRIQFVFIAPERLLIQEFRDQLRAMEKKRVFISYGVIDEAHCVSEWGHDFRTPYLRLAHNLREFLPVELHHSLRLIALTGTASYDVLDDIKRELEVTSDDAIIQPETLSRDELQFVILPVPISGLTGTNEWNDRNAVGQAKTSYLTDLITNLKRYFTNTMFATADFHALNGRETCSGLIFCPYKSDKMAAGVPKVQAAIVDSIQSLKPITGVYASADDEDDDSGDGPFAPHALQKTQADFRDNRLAMLVATKAFGMGIDKPNIRYTIHFNIPSSIESFYQEAGRAGRDRAKANCFILLAQGMLPNGQPWKDCSLMESFHKESFKGIARDLAQLKDVLYEKPKDGEVEYPSLMDRLSGVGFRDQITFVVDFNNRRVRDITQYLSFLGATKKGFSEKEVAKQLRFTTSYEEFCSKLTSALSKYIDPKAHETQLKPLFESVRTTQDTAKVIYRLTAIGLVKDYTIDYNKKRYKLTLGRLTDEAMIQRLQTYIGRFASHADVRQVPDTIHSRPESEHVERCLGYLLDFVYDRIEKKRAAAIKTMQAAAEEGLQSSQAFTDRVDNYFNSSYLPRLRKYRIEYTLDTIWQFVDDVANSSDLKNQAKHLRGACDRLVGENPDNGALYLLRAYAALLFDAPFGEIQDDFQRGWELFTRQGSSRQQIASAMTKFYYDVSRLNPDEGRVRAESLLVDWHNTWLKDFNQRHFAGVMEV